MGYLTLKVHSPAGKLIFESDFTLAVFIPLVRHITRTLEARAYLATHLGNYVAVITPHYDRSPRPQESIKLPNTPPRETTHPSGVLTISEEDFVTETPVAYDAEIQAYYHPGSSPLCTNCPERKRCPGSGVVKEENLTHWIMLDTKGVQTNEAIHYFTLRLETKEGEWFYKRDFLVSALQHFVDAVSYRLIDAGQLPQPVGGKNTATLVARYDHQPTLNPLMAQLYLPLTSDTPGAAFPQANQPNTLVNWDDLEAERNDEEVDITVIDTQTELFDTKPMPSLDRCEAVGVIDQQDLPIFVHHFILDGLYRSVQEETQGVLVGAVFASPPDNRPYIEIKHFIPAAEAFPEGSIPTFEYRLWRYVDSRLNRDFPGQRVMGWYRVHLLGPTLLTIHTGRHTIHAGTDERLFLSKEELFLHQNFFSEAWHVGLIADPIKGRCRFYQWRDRQVIAASGYFVVHS